MSIKFRVLGGVLGGGGGSADFIFMGARIFLKEARSDHGRTSPQPRDFTAAATMGH